ncbi:MAG: type II toxin-antitoxin system RelE/ParE family toxin [Thiotrichaceae bacterium]|nr:type II toxin-antitoxin system RelE/ParE family toxin [Thiotrichaceae bacterium]PCI11126.1 MAG: plasmid stabilization protein [Thiotrichales bacterium]PCI12897.1 MAG: plasmid stabilization protein [Thiotrichales bacterium]
MQIKWLHKALKNLDDEAKYIAQDAPLAAQLVVQRIVQAVSLLSDNPSFGHPGRLPGTHELVIPNTRYIVPYRVRPRLQRIEILRVFHASRKPPERW